MLHLDAGGFSPISRYLNQGKTRALLASYKMMSLDAINISAKELGDDACKFIDIAKEYNLPLLSTNLVYEDSGETLFNRSLQIDFAGKRFTILGITKKTRTQWRDEKGRLIITRDPGEALDEFLDQVEPGERVILLAYMPRREMKKLLERVEGIDLVLACDGYTQTVQPEMMGETTIIYPGSQGKYFGKMSLNPSQGPVVQPRSVDLVFLPQEYQEDEEVAEILRTLQVQKEANK